MSNQYETPAPTNEADKRVILIFIGGFLAMCCLCITITGCSLGALAVWAGSAEQGNFQFPGEAPITGRENLDVTRAEMIDFFSADRAFEFAEPTAENGLELVKGTHTGLCLAQTCAVVTLGGPEENLMIVTAAAPTDTKEPAQTSKGLALLMKTAKRFTDGEHLAAIPTQVMSDILMAQASGEEFKKSFANNGYVFTEMYDPKTQQATLSITPANDLHGPIGNNMPNLIAVSGAAHRAL